MSPLISGYLYKNSDNAVEFADALDIVSGQPANTATMKVWLYTQGGVPIEPAVTWPLDGQYIIDSAGHYYAVIQDSIDWTADSIYKMVIEIDGGANRKLTRVQYMELIE